MVRMLGDILEIKLVKAPIEDFIPLFQENYGVVNYDSYHRSNEVWAAVAKWRQEAYFFVQNDRIIGGVLQPESIVTGLFTIPPYANYKEILEVLLLNLECKEYTFYEVPRIYSHHYDDRFELQRTEVMMYMKPCSQELILPQTYTSHNLYMDDIEEIGQVFFDAFSTCKVYKSVDPIETFTESAKSFFNYTKSFPKLYNATKLVRDKDGNIAGVILSMMDDGMPFAYNLAVAPHHQSKGIGKYLITSLVEGVKDV